MLVNIKLLLAKQKKPKFFTFSIQPKNKYHLRQDIQQEVEHLFSLQKNFKNI